MVCFHFFLVVAHQYVNMLIEYDRKDDVNPTGYWMSEKLDGVRAYWFVSPFLFLRSMCNLQWESCVN
jgi:ATP-dependent DNA ligase